MTVKETTLIVTRKKSMYLDNIFSKTVENIDITRNIKVENSIKDHHFVRCHDTYFTEYAHVKYPNFPKAQKLENTFGLFQNHYKQFRPVLDEIAGVDRSQLKHINSEIIATEKITPLVKKMKEFTKEDITQFFNGEFPDISNITPEKLAETKWFQFVQSKCPNFNEIPHGQEYLRMVKEKIPASVDDINAAAIHLHIEENAEVTRLTFEKSKVYGQHIELHKNFSLAVAKIKDKLLKHCTEEQLQMISEFVSNNETFSLLATEPGLLTAMGAPFFLPIFYALHHEGAFSKLMTTAVNSEINYREYLWLQKEAERMQIEEEKRHEQRLVLIKDTSVQIVSLFKNDTINYLTGAAAAATSAFVYNSVYNWWNGTKIQKQPIVATKPPVNAITVQTIKFIESGKGLENSTVDRALNFSKLISNDIGKAVGGVVSSFIKGVLSNNKEAVTAVTETIDNHLNNNDKIQQLKNNQKK